MSQVKIKYGKAQELQWSQAKQLSAVGSAAAVVVLMQDETVVVLKSYDTQDRAQAVHDALQEDITAAVNDGEGGITIIDIEDY